MSFNKAKNSNGYVKIKRQRLKEVVKAAQELEAKGYEPVAPIQRLYFQGKKFDDKSVLLNGMTKAKKKQFVEAVETVSYVIYMKKVES